VLFPIFETASEAVGAALAGVNAPVDWPVADLAAAG
jgi:hypothetical protein